MSQGWEQIKGLFIEALQLDPEERAKFLAHNCPGGTFVRQEVESLLRAHEKAEGYFEAVDQLPGSPVDEILRDTSRAFESDVEARPAAKPVVSRFHSDVDSSTKDDVCQQADRERGEASCDDTAPAPDLPGVTGDR